MTPAATTPARTARAAAGSRPGFDPRLGPARRWTRAHWLATADRLLDAVAPFASPGGALIPLPGPVSASGAWSDGLEGYARTFLLAAFRVRGEDGGDPQGLLERYADGLRHGTDPAGAERWPRIDERRQAVVEAASVAIGLAETRPWLWDRLDERTRERTVAWLTGVVGTRGYTNNWLWFQNVVEAFLAGVGGPWDQADLDRNAETAESLYVGDGWYSDGRGRDGRRQSFDHYAGWAWHVYPLLHARIRGTALEQRHADRLRAFLEQAQHLISSHGAPLLQGRSVTYRTAVLAPFWAGALADTTPLPAGATRALTAAVADHFVAAGAIDDRGLLPVGWHGRFDRVRQLYTGGSSPYWASKGFLGLLLPADHPVWTAEPELPEPWRADRVTALPAPGWLVSATPADGLVRVLNHGSDRAQVHPMVPRADDPFYRRLAYSGATSPQLSPQDVAAPLDSHTALLDTRGVPSHRDTVDRVHLHGTPATAGTDDTDGNGGVAVSRSRVVWLDTPGSGTGDDAGWASMRRGPVLTTASVLRGRDEVRLAWWTPTPAVNAARPPGPDLAVDVDLDVAWPADEGPWTLHVGGWALAAPGDVRLRVERGDEHVRVVRDDGTVSCVRALPVHAGNRTATVLDVAGGECRTGADPLGASSAFPWLRTSEPLPRGEIAAALVVLGGPSPRDFASPPAIHVLARCVEVRWADGHVDVVPRDSVPVDTALPGAAAARATTPEAGS